MNLLTDSHATVKLGLHVVPAFHCSGVGFLMIFLTVTLTVDFLTVALGIVNLTPTLGVVALTPTLTPTLGVVALTPALTAGTLAPTFTPTLGVATLAPAPTLTPTLGVVALTPVLIAGTLAATLTEAFGVGALATNACKSLIDISILFFFGTGAGVLAVQFLACSFKFESNEPAKFPNFVVDHITADKDFNHVSKDDFLSLSDFRSQQVESKSLQIDLSLYSTGAARTFIPNNLAIGQLPCNTMADALAEVDPPALRETLAPVDAFPPRETLAPADGNLALTPSLGVDNFTAAPVLALTAGVLAATLTDAFGLTEALTATFGVAAATKD